MTVNELIEKLHEEQRNGRGHYTVTYENMEIPQPQNAHFVTPSDLWETVHIG